MLAVLTGPVRSGKSRLALELASRRGRDVLLAVAGRADDEEMARRIERHKASRPDELRVLEIVEPGTWLDEVPGDACLVLDCLGTLTARLMGPSVPDDAELAERASEEQLFAAVDGLVDRLLARSGDTIVVTNEVGWGVVPATPSGRLFRDALGRANARLTEGADAAWLVVCGRVLDLTAAGRDVSWPEA